MISMPGVLYTDKNGNTKMMDLATRLLTDRCILLTGEIDEDMANSVIQQLLYLESEDKDKPVKMVIQSPGGEIYAGYSIIDTMNKISCPVHTVATGMVASMATTIFLNGKKGERSMYPHAQILIHQPLLAGGGFKQVSDVEIQTTQGIKLKKQLTEEYSKLTGIPLKKMEKMMDRDTVLDAENCKKLKICDKIL